MEVNDLRKKIDEVDDQICKLLAQRFDLTDEIGKIKKSKSKEIADGKREREILSRVLASSGESSLEIEQIYKLLFTLSKRRQFLSGKKFALVGGKTGQSYSSVIHRALGYPYELISTTEDKLNELFRSGEYAGFNVTVPFKKIAFKLVDEVDEIAGRTGTVNTVIVKNGKLFGYNTDYYGMKYALDNAGISLLNKNVMILGTGGTSGTARVLCEDCGADSVTVVGRTSAINYQNCYDCTNVQVIINATPVGMFPDISERVIEVGRFQKLETVFDAVYNPYKTLFVSDAKKLGLKACGGFEMLVAQAVKSSELFTGTVLPYDVTGAISVYLKSKVLNIVFAGMPGSGKTELAKRTAKTLGLRFYDVDELIETSQGKNIPEIFKEKGEAFFRKVESEQIEELFSCISGAVISLGGGSVLSEKNREIICRNSRVVVLLRDVEKLAKDGRPCSSDIDKVRTLEKERMPIYREIGDFFVDNNSSIEQTEKALAEFLR